MSEPPSYISHEEMCRRILHCAIRMHFSLEDSLANHIFCQSLFRVTSDLHLKRFNKDLVDAFFEEHKKPSWFNKKTFYDQFNINYNKLKHADRDKFDPQRIEYFNLNSITIMICIFGYNEIFKKISIHQVYFLIYQSSFLQDTLELSSFEGNLPNIARIVEAIRDARIKNGNEFAWNTLANQFFKQPEIQQEIEADRAH